MTASTQGFRMEAPEGWPFATRAPPLTLREMPALEALDDEKLAALLTYIRREWGHQASPISPATVREIRQQTLQHYFPWTEAELLKIK